MKNALLKWIAALAVSVSQTVSAVPITETVIVGNQEWAQVSLFTRVSWNTLNAQCPGGVCSIASTANGHDLAGWTWASNDTMQALFNSFTGLASPAPTTTSEQDAPWSPIFAALFTPTDYSPGGRIATGGWTSTTPGNEISYYAYSSSYPDPTDDDELGFSFIQFGNDFRFDSLGAWFVRDANQVPVPATLSLFGLGVASMWIARRKLDAKV